MSKPRENPKTKKGPARPKKAQTSLKATERRHPRYPNLVYRNGLLVNVGSKWVGGATDDTIEQAREERTERIIRRSLGKDPG